MPGMVVSPDTRERTTTRKLLYLLLPSFWFWYTVRWRWWPSLDPLFYRKNSFFCNIRSFLEFELDWRCFVMGSFLSRVVVCAFVALVASFSQLSPSFEFRTSTTHFWCQLYDCILPGPWLVENNRCILMQLRSEEITMFFIRSLTSANSFDWTTRFYTSAICPRNGKIDEPKNFDSDSSTVSCHSIMIQSRMTQKAFLWTS